MKEINVEYSLYERWKDKLYNATGEKFPEDVFKEWLRLQVDEVS